MQVLLWCVVAQERGMPADGRAVRRACMQEVPQPSHGMWTISQGCRQRSAPGVQQPCHHLHQARACSCNVPCVSVFALPL